MISTRVIRQPDRMYRVESVNEDGSILRVELDRNGNRFHERREHAITLATRIYRDAYAAANPPRDEPVWTSAELLTTTG